MKPTLLTKLYRHSKPGFILLLSYCLIFAILLSKKMDMLFFPRNDMFSHYEVPSDSMSLFRLTCNHHQISIGKYAYWKKEILETAPGKYAYYIIHHQTPASVFTQNKGLGSDFFSSAWNPSAIRDVDWFSWYLRYASMQIKKGDICRLMQYKLRKKNTSWTIKDSLVLAAVQF